MLKSKKNEVNMQEKLESLERKVDDMSSKNNLMIDMMHEMMTMIGRLDKETKSIIKQSAEAAEMKSETESLRKRVADLDEELQLYQELRELTRREDILATVDSDGDDSANPPADKETEISMKRLRATLLQVKRENIAKTKQVKALEMLLAAKLRDEMVAGDRSEAHSSAISSMPFAFLGMHDSQEGRRETSSLPSSSENFTWSLPANPLASSPANIMLQDGLTQVRQSATSLFSNLPMLNGAGGEHTDKGQLQSSAQQGEENEALSPSRKSGDRKVRFEGGGHEQAGQQQAEGGSAEVEGEAKELQASKPTVQV